MSAIMDKIKAVFFEKARPLSSGFYSFSAPPESELPYRLHLRIDANAEGVLIINASTVLHLNQTATEFAYHFIKQTPKNEVVQSFIDRYQTSYSDAQRDYESFFERIETLINMPDLDPVTYLDIERENPFDHALSAPYRLDCALTYNLSSSNGEGISPQRRVERELTTEEWKKVATTAWEAGIPHLVFTGGEPTTRPDLVDLLQYSQDLGQVTGLITDGVKLSDWDYLERLLNAGLDHLQITFDPHLDSVWQALKNALDEDIHVTAHMTVNEENAELIEKVMNELKELGLENISLSSSSINLLEKTRYLRDLSAELGFNFIWNLPVPYSQYNPVSQETQKVNEIPEGAGVGWLYIEPDGDVLPTQGINQVIGNMVTDDWATIWEKARQQVKESS